MRNNVLEGFYAELRRQPIPDPDEVKNPLFLEAVFVPSKLGHSEYWELLDHFTSVSNGKQMANKVYQLAIGKVMMYLKLCNQKQMCLFSLPLMS